MVQFSRPEMQRNGQQQQGGGGEGGIENVTFWRELSESFIQWGYILRERLRHPTVCLGIFKGKALEATKA